MKVLKKMNLNNLTKFKSIPTGTVILIDDMYYMKIGDGKTGNLWAFEEDCMYTYSKEDEFRIVNAELHIEEQ